MGILAKIHKTWIGHHYKIMLLILFGLITFAALAYADPPLPPVAGTPASSGKDCTQCDSNSMCGCSRKCKGQCGGNTISCMPTNEVISRCPPSAATNKATTGIGGELECIVAGTCLPGVAP